MFDYKDRDSNTKYNQVLNYLSQVFALFFLIEAIIKIIAQGLVTQKESYLRDPWNVMDLLIVVTGTVEIIIFFSSSSASVVKLKALRNLRVLRPLRSLNSIPGMKRLVSTLISSLYDLLNVGIFVGFLFILFGILGL